MEDIRCVARKGRVWQVKPLHGEVEVDMIPCRHCGLPVLNIGTSSLCLCGHGLHWLDYHPYIKDCFVVKLEGLKAEDLGDVSRYFNTLF